MQNGHVKNTTGLFDVKVCPRDKGQALGIANAHVWLNDVELNGVTDVHFTANAGEGGRMKLTILVNSFEVVGVGPPSLERMQLNFQDAASIAGQPGDCAPEHHPV